MSGTDATTGGPGADDVHAYCRDVEAHLCRRNGGHLIRVVGPAFDLVKGWAAQGIPLALVREAIDRVVERGDRKPGRRRPIRIEFCEADVLDGYDRWRRAVGVGPADDAPRGSGSARGSLHAHVERVIVQLTALLGSDRAPAPLRPAVQTALGALDGLLGPSVTARGAARENVLAALVEIDATLVAAATRALPPGQLAALGEDAAAELSGYRGRLAAAQWESALAAVRDRLVRAAAGLPIVRFD